MRVYFAHAICTYGYPEEQEQLTTARRRFSGAEIVNPADNPGDVADDARAMDHYLMLLKGCDLVVFIRLYGKVTAGVGKEVNFALGRHMKVYELRGTRFIRRTQPVKYITRSETVRLYRRWHERHGSLSRSEVF